MSLKAIHIVFIAASILLCFGFGLWLYKQFSLHHTQVYLISSVLSGLTGLGLIAYGIATIRKFRHISYL